MRIREWKESDEPILERFYHQQGFAYDLPDPKSADMLTALVLESAGEVRAAALLRLEVNAMLLLDNRWQKPQVRLIALQQIHEAARQKALGAGIEHANAWLPPEIEKQFAPRLMDLKWERCLWPSYTRQVNQE
jgi:hypothetical protein